MTFHSPCTMWTSRERCSKVSPMVLPSDHCNVHHQFLPSLKAHQGCGFSFIGTSRVCLEGVESNVVSRDPRPFSYLFQESSCSRCCAAKSSSPWRCWDPPFEVRQPAGDGRHRCKLGGVMTVSSAGAQGATTLACMPTGCSV